jgi:ubiquinol-cytochrome c reductase cytochrome c1 subunit
MLQPLLKCASLALIAGTMVLGSANLSFAEDEPAAGAFKEIELPKVNWSFYGVTGTYDLAQLQRGYQIYKEVCSGCHSMKLMSYRNLGGGPGISGGDKGDPPGIGLSEAEVKAIAAEYKVPAEPNDAGEIVERPALPSDHFVSPFPNEQAARASNNGALPPDFSLIAKAREGGPDYIHALLTGYTDAPAGMKMNDGMYFNKYFAAGLGQIAMPPPIGDNAVTYADGTKATLDQEAQDVAAFLMWVAEPNLPTRHRTGVEVILYLIVATGLLYAAKRKIWSKIH